MIEPGERGGGYGDAGQSMPAGVVDPADVYLRRVAALHERLGYLDVSPGLYTQALTLLTMVVDRDAGAISDAGDFDNLFTGTPDALRVILNGQGMNDVEGRYHRADSNEIFYDGSSANGNRMFIGYHAGGSITIDSHPRATPDHLHSGAQRLSSVGWSKLVLTPPGKYGDSMVISGAEEHHIHSSDSPDQLQASARRAQQLIQGVIDETMEPEVYDVVRASQAQKLQYVFDTRIAEALVNWGTPQATEALGFVLPFGESTNGSRDMQALALTSHLFDDFFRRAMTTHPILVSSSMPIHRKGGLSVEYVSPLANDGERLRTLVALKECGTPTVHLQHEAADGSRWRTVQSYSYASDPVGIVTAFEHVEPWNRLNRPYARDASAFEVIDLFRHVYRVDSNDHGALAAEAEYTAMEV